MRMNYLDGSSGHDDLFDLPFERQRRHIALCMGYNPDAPQSWHGDAIETLLAVRRLKGRRAFYVELGRMLTQ